MKTASVLRSLENAGRNAFGTAARRGRWLTAAVLALGTCLAPALAEDAATPVKDNKAEVAAAAPKAAGPLLQAFKDLKLQKQGLDDKVVPPAGSDPRVIFEKTGVQIDCGRVVFTLRFGVKADAAAWANPAMAGLLSAIRLDLKDQLPVGLSVMSASVTGDVTGAAGVNAPVVSISANAAPDDTMSIADFRLSASDLNGDGSASERYAEIKITAKIDPAAFPAVTQIANQASVTSSLGGGAGNDYFSHDPALPDDGDEATGEKTKVTIDVTKCAPPDAGGTPDEACFKIASGTVDCGAAGAFVYHMSVGAEMAGQVVEITTDSPGVSVAPMAQIVPAGGGVLNWTITGAKLGDVVHLTLVGTQTFAGPKEGWGVCCTQAVVITIPKDLDCPKAQADIKIEKKADVSTCTEAGGCKFTIRVSNAGDGSYDGPIVLKESASPGNPVLDGGPGSPWTCAASAGQTLCKHPSARLDPGASISLNLSFKPGPGARFIRNCAAYDYEQSGKPLFGSQSNDRACAEIALCDPDGSGPQDRACQPPVEKKIDLKIRKTAREFCTADGLCFYSIIVTNAGTVTHNGPLTITDTFPGGAPASAAFSPSPPWACAAQTPGDFKCDLPGTVLVPGASTLVTVRAIVPLDYANGKVENCAKLSAVSGETDLANNSACATAKLRHPDQAEISVKKTGPEQCEAGKPCVFNVTISNKGSAAFAGRVQIGDALEIDGIGRVEGGAIQSVEPPFGCPVEPPALPFGCLADVSLAAGESRTHAVTLVIPDSASVSADGLQGRNCVGVTNELVTINAAGPAAGQPEGAAYSCHQFTLVKQPDDKQCSGGFVKNANGRCVCPEGTTFSQGRGRCVSAPDPAAPEGPKASPQCKLLPGMIRTKDNRCLCPRGTELRNGACKRPIVAEQCKLLPGQIRTKSGQCICPRNTALKAGRCEATVRQCALLPGQIRTKDNKCICPRGTVLGRKGCVKVTNPGTTCPKGTRLINGECMRPVGDGENARKCPPGTIGVFPLCIRPDQIQRCPRGTEGRYPNCKRIDTEPDFPDLEIPGRDSQTNPG